MKIGLAIENDVAVANLMPAVFDIDRALKSCFASKEYGSDTLNIAIGTVLVSNSTISQRLHPVRPFKFKRLEKVKHPGTGQIMELYNSASWDVKPDFEKFSGMGLNDARNYLCEYLIASTRCLEDNQGLFPNFEVARFIADFELCLREHCSSKKS